MIGDCDERYMREALTLAQQAFSTGEVPVGAVVVRDGEVIGSGWNKPVTTADPSAHAELVALREAALRSGNYRLPDTTLYVTVEPCMMCAGALVHARVARLVYGAAEPKAGAVRSHPLLNNPYLNHQVEIGACVLPEECGELMSAFFAARRAAADE